MNETEKINGILQGIRTADAALSGIAVRGDDVYALIRARAALKRAHDELAEENGKEGTENAAEYAG